VVFGAIECPQTDLVPVTTAQLVVCVMKKCPQNLSRGEGGHGLLNIPQMVLTSCVAAPGQRRPK